MPQVSLSCAILGFWSIRHVVSLYKLVPCNLLRFALALFGWTLKSAQHIVGSQFHLFCRAFAACLTSNLFKALAAASSEKQKTTTNTIKSKRKTQSSKSINIHKTTGKNEQNGVYQ
eukprot:2838624-Amphidinium_carterae.2